MNEGTTYKQCGCKDAQGRRLGKNCPKLRRGNGTWSTGHGSWHYQLEMPPKADGSRRGPLRRGGFATVEDAAAELGTVRDLLALAAPGDDETRIRIADAITHAVKTTRRLPDPASLGKAIRLGHDPAAPQVTVAQWLDEWLAGKQKLRASTVRSSYGPHIRLYFQPHIGHIRLAKLRVADVASVFEAIDELNDTVTDARDSGDPAIRAKVKGRRTVGPATKQRIRATLRSAITTYIRQHPGMLDVNVAALLELPAAKRPKALVWTDDRVTAWRADFEARLAAARAAANGGRVSPVDIWISTPRPSPVMVWTPTQTAVFLTRARRDRLYALYHLIAYRGLRRGEGCGLRRTDTDLAKKVTNVRWQITQLGWGTRQGPPKSEAGERQVALDAQTTAVLGAHRGRLDKELANAGFGGEPEFEFTNPDGTPLHPAAVTTTFELIAYLAGLPPIRLHDLRHGAATMALAAGVDIKIVQEMLGHSARSLTSDTYTSVLPELAHAAAEAAAALIPLDPAAKTRVTRRRRPKSSRSAEGAAAKPDQDAARRPDEAA